MGPSTPIIILLLLTLSINLNGLSIRKRIVGGRTATQNQFIYQVSIQTPQFHQHACGGAIIHENWILTAAHCVREIADKPESAVVHVGANELIGGNAFHYNISHIFIHPNLTEKWARRITNDIALIRTTAPIQFIPNQIEPVKLPKNSLPNAGGIEVIISGWGSIKVSSNKKRKTKIPINRIPFEI